MKTLYLHIGMHKTGTTAIQNFLFLNKELLSGNGLSYYSDVPVDYRFAEALQKKQDLEYVEERIKGLKRISHDKVVMSCEGLIQGDHIPRLLLELFEKEGVLVKYNVRIIIYIRRQDSWLESAYLQISKDLLWKPLSFDKYCSITALDYYLNYIYTWKNIFGRDRMIIKTYEKEQLKNQSILDDFMDIFNIRPADGYRMPPEELSNIGIDVVEAYILNQTKTLFQSKAELDRFLQLVKRNKEKSFTRCLLSRVQIKEILLRYRDYNRQLNVDFSINKKEYLFSQQIKRSDDDIMSAEQIKKSALKLLVNSILDLQRNKQQ